MVGVVAYGTGTAAALPGIEGRRQDRDGGAGGHARPRDRRERCADPTNTDAWFTAYAPAGQPKIVVAVMLVRAGAGGATAAPAARVSARCRHARSRTLDVELAREVPAALASISSSSGRFSVFSSGSWKSSIEPAVGPSWATLLGLGDAFLRVELFGAVGEWLSDGSCFGLELLSWLSTM